jgi:hypothetical protein
MFGAHRLGLGGFSAGELEGFLVRQFPVLAESLAGAARRLVADGQFIVPGAARGVGEVLLPAQDS